MGRHLIGEKATDASAQKYQGAVVALGFDEVDEEIDPGVVTHGCGNRRPRAPVQRQVDGSEATSAAMGHSAPLCPPAPWTSSTRAGAPGSGARAMCTRWPCHRHHVDLGTSEAACWWWGGRKGTYGLACIRRC